MKHSIGTVYGVTFVIIVVIVTLISAYTMRKVNAGGNTEYYSNFFSASDAPVNQPIADDVLFIKRSERRPLVTPTPAPTPAPVSQVVGVPSPAPEDEILVVPNNVTNSKQVAGTGSSDGYGVKKDGSVMRMYAPKSDPSAGLSMSLVKPDGGFEDILSVERQGNKDYRLVSKGRFETDSINIGNKFHVMNTGHDEWLRVVNPSNYDHFYGGVAMGKIFATSDMMVKGNSTFDGRVNVRNQLSAQKLCIEDLCLTKQDLQRVLNINAQSQPQQPQVQYVQQQSQLQQQQQVQQMMHVNMNVSSPSDCQVGQWSSWGSCSKPCGGGTQTRTRPLVKPASNGGAPCPSLVETQNCNIEACGVVEQPKQSQPQPSPPPAPVNCEVSSWSGWSACDKSCGGGSQTRSRTIVKPASNGGTQCPPLSESQKCNTHECPPELSCYGAKDGECRTCEDVVNAYKSRYWKYDTNDFVQCPKTVNCEVSGWSDWSACDKPCGGGSQTRTRTVVKAASNGGTPCPALTESKKCNEQSCQSREYMEFKNVDFFGNDILYDPNIAFPDCKQKCDSISGCTTFVQNKGAGKGCWFKNKAENYNVSKTLDSFLITSMKGIQIRHPDGRPWKVGGNNALQLNTGNAMTVDIFNNSRVYNNSKGRVALLQNGDVNLGVRHGGYVMWVNPFTDNHYDWAWYFEKTDSGVRIRNDFGNGHFVGYDAPSDRILIVPQGDNRIVNWIMTPMPPASILR